MRLCFCLHCNLWMFEICAIYPLLHNFLAKPNSSSLVTGESIDANPRRYFFFPVNADWQKRIAAFLGSSQPKKPKNHYGEINQSTELQHCYPKKLVNVKGDGACLPRCLSMVIYGNQRHHVMLRNAVVDFMIRNSETAPLDAGFLHRMEEMRKTTTWMGTDEVQAFAYLLDTPIYTCVQVKSNGKPNQFCWQRLPHPELASNVGNDRGIYLLNAHDHFQVITKP